MISCLAFDCFGTVFNMDDVPRDEIRAYVNHVRSNDFSPYEFPESWYSLPAHRDAPDGIRMLQEKGYFVCTLSNGSKELLSRVGKANGIHWDYVIDLVAHGVYKPNQRAYSLVELDTGFTPKKTLMVTANPAFGDLEGAKGIGMPYQVIRNGPPATIIELAKQMPLAPKKRMSIE